MPPTASWSPAARGTNRHGYMSTPILQFAKQCTMQLNTKQRIQNKIVSKLEVDIQYSSPVFIISLAMSMLMMVITIVMMMTMKLMRQKPDLAVDTEIF